MGGGQWARRLCMLHHLVHNKDSIAARPNLTAQHSHSGEHR